MPGDKWLALAKLHCRGAFSCLPLPADVSLSTIAKKPKLEAGAGVEELNVLGDEGNAGTHTHTK